MTREEIEKLLAGYATQTLTAEERRELFEAALTDQALFDQIAAEEPLRELLADPLVREDLIEELSVPPSPSLEDLYSLPEFAALNADLGMTVASSLPAGADQEENAIPEPVPVPETPSFRQRFARWLTPWTLTAATVAVGVLVIATLRSIPSRDIPQESAVLSKVEAPAESKNAESAPAPDKSADTSLRTSAAPPLRRKRQPEAKPSQPAAVPAAPEPQTYADAVRAAPIRAQESGSLADRSASGQTAGLRPPPEAMFAARALAKSSALPVRAVLQRQAGASWQPVVPGEKVPRDASLRIEVTAPAAGLLSVVLLGADGQRSELFSGSFSGAETWNIPPGAGSSQLRISFHPAGDSMAEARTGNAAAPPYSTTIPFTRE